MTASNDGMNRLIRSRLLHVVGPEPLPAEQPVGRSSVGVGGTMQQVRVDPNDEAYRNAPPAPVPLVAAAG